VVYDPKNEEEEQESEDDEMSPAKWVHNYYIQTFEFYYL
jgi:hypothetical protein